MYKFLLSLHKTHSPIKTTARCVTTKFPVGHRGHSPVCVHVERTPVCVCSVFTCVRNVSHVTFRCTRGETRRPHPRCRRSTAANSQRTLSRRCFTCVCRRQDHVGSARRCNNFRVGCRPCRFKSHSRLPRLVALLHSGGLNALLCFFAPLQEKRQ